MLKADMNRLTTFDVSLFAFIRKEWLRVMKRLLIIALVAGVALVVSGCMPSTPSSEAPIDPADVEFIQYNPMQDGEEVAIIETTLGQMKMRLFPREAPITVTHFRKLVKEGYYTNKKIFLEGTTKAMVTGAVGDDIREGKLATDDGKKISTEITQNLWHFTGAVSAWGEPANRFNNDILSDSRFFIIGDIPADTELITQMEQYEYPEKVINKYKEEGGLPHFTGSYTVFGQIYEGIHIVKQITDKATGVKDKGAYALEDIVIKSITLDKYEAQSVSSGAVSSAPTSDTSSATDSSSDEMSTSSTGSTAA